MEKLEIAENLESKNYNWKMNTNEKLNKSGKKAAPNEMPTTCIKHSLGKY